jgi:hypothetical protein
MCRELDLLIDWLFDYGGWSYTSELLPSTGLLFITGWYVSLEGHGDDDDDADWDNYWLVRQSSLAVQPVQTSGASRKNGWRSENFACQYLEYLKGSSTCRKIIRHRTSGFTAHPKEGVLRTFIILKNPSHRQGLNPRPLGQVASTLTTTPV